MGIIVNDIYNWSFGNLTNTFISLKEPIDIRKSEDENGIRTYTISTRVYRYYSYELRNSQSIQVFLVSFNCIESELVKPIHEMVFDKIKEDLDSFSNN